MSVFGGLVLNIVMQFYVLYCTRAYICIPAIKAVRDLYVRYHDDVFIDGVFSDDAWALFSHVEDFDFPTLVALGASVGSLSI